MTAPPRSTKALAGQHETFEALIPGTSQALAFTGASAQSAALGASTTILRLFSTQDCFVTFGANPTAAANTSVFVPGGIVDFIGVPPGTSKVAAISNGTNGTLYITEGQ